MENITKVEDLTSACFEKYGKIFEVPDFPPPKTGEGWDCWNYITMMNVTEPIGIGLVITKQRVLSVDAMERHVSREELLLPFNKEIIQPVALCLDIDDPEEKPDPSTVRCFRIKPGQGIIIAKGVWHSPAYSIDGDTTYLFGIEKKPDKFGDEMVNPWVTFKKNESIKMKLE
jgi:ureidoglycolate lyase